MNVLFALRYGDLLETIAGTRSIIKTLGFMHGMKALNYASIKHFRAMMKGEGAYPEKGKQREWFKLNYLKHIYDYLKIAHKDDADTFFDEIIRAPSLKFIGSMIPPAEKFTKDFVLNHVWPHLIARDYNVEAVAMPSDGNSASLHVTRCFIHEVAMDVGLKPVADRLCHGDYIFWETYHPNVKFSRTHTLVNGDDHCNHTITWVDANNLKRPVTQ